MKGEAFKYLVTIRFGGPGNESVIRARENFGKIRERMVEMAGQNMLLVDASPTGEMAIFAIQTTLPVHAVTSRLSDKILLNEDKCLVIQITDQAEYSATNLGKAMAWLQHH